MEPEKPIMPSSSTAATQRPKPPQRLVRWILGVSLLLGITGDILIRSHPLGVNVPLVFGLLCLCLIWGWKRHQEPHSCWPLLVIAFMLSLSITWRDASILRALNSLAILVILLIVSSRPAFIQLHSGTLLSLLTNSLNGMGEALSTPILLFFYDIEWSRPSSPPLGGHTKKILRGLLIAIPLLLVFMGLFSAADAIFKNRVETLFDHVGDLVMNSEQLAYHFGYTILFGILAALILRPMVLGEKWKDIEKAPPATWILGSIEVAIVMGSILLLFLSFILIQFRYLFGGHAMVQTAKALTYATYARKGFFALLVVVVLVHVILLLGTWLLKKAGKQTQSLFRWAGLGLIVLTSVIFVSAFFRLSLYVAAYGLTQSRFYAAAVLVWLSIVYLLTATQLVFPRWSFFTGAYLHSFLAVLLLLSAVNPDATIARINLERLVVKGDLDYVYLQGLSTDAVPTILAYQSHLSPDKTRELVQHIVTTRHANETDWRSWNASRAKARKHQSAGVDQP